MSSSCRWVKCVLLPLWLLLALAAGQVLVQVLVCIVHVRLHLLRSLLLMQSYLPMLL